MTTLQSAIVAQQPLLQRGGRSAYLDFLATAKESEITRLKIQLDEAQAEMTRLKTQVASRFNLSQYRADAPQPIYLAEGVMLLPPGAKDPDLPHRAQERAEDRMANLDQIAFEQLDRAAELRRARQHNTGMGFLTSAYVAEKGHQDD